MLVNPPVFVPMPRPLAQGYESWASWWPRGWLNWLELHGDPRPPQTPQEITSAINFWRNRRVALVKQSAYSLLYQKSAHCSWQDKVLSCPSHLGPFSFLADLGADYWIVRQDSAPETRSWKGKYSMDPDPEKSFQRQEDFIHDWERSEAGNQAVGVDEVDWSKYDLVVGLDIPIPERRVQRCPHTLWSYFSVEAGGPLQKNSLRHPIAGYQLFLNHGFRRYRSRPRNHRHVLEFPFSFQSRDAWDRLAALACPETVRSSRILVEGQSWEPERVADEPAANKLSAENATEYVRAMRSHQIALRASRKIRWGNWAVEAVQSGCLFLADPDSLAHRSLLLPDLVCDNLAEGLRQARSLLDRPELLHSLRILQESLAEWFCFQRPLLELTARARELRR